MHQRAANIVFSHGANCYVCIMAMVLFSFFFTAAVNLNHCCFEASTRISNLFTIRREPIVLLFSLSLFNSKKLNVHNEAMPKRVIGF